MRQAEAGLGGWGVARFLRCSSRELVRKAVRLVLVASAVQSLTAADAGSLPMIVAQPQSQSVAPWTNATFTVSALSPSPMRYQWRVNSSEITGATNSTLTLTNLDFHDVGYYTVLVSNEAGAVSSTEARLFLAFGYGEVNFSNGAAGVNAPVYYQGLPLSGPDWVAQMYAGPSLESLEPFGSPVPFRTGIGVGYFSGGARQILSVEPIHYAWVQARVWRLSEGTTYEETTGPRGWSNPVFIQTSGDTPP